MQKHILLVDSDAESQSRLSQTLQQCNYRVSTASTCAESLAKIASDRPDCVVFDVELEGTPGGGVHICWAPACVLWNGDSCSFKKLFKRSAAFYRQRRNGIALLFLILA